MTSMHLLNTKILFPTSINDETSELSTVLGRLYWAFSLVILELVPYVGTYESHFLFTDERVVFIHILLTQWTSTPSVGPSVVLDLFLNFSLCSNNRCHLSQQSCN